jgi:hypothetical protein
MTIQEFQQICKKYGLQQTSTLGLAFGYLNTSFVIWGNNIRVIPEYAWKFEKIIKGNFVYDYDYPYCLEDISKKDPKKLEEYLIKLSAWYKTFVVEQKLQKINEDFK